MNSKLTEGLDRIYYDSLKETRRVIENNLNELNEAKKVIEVLALGKNHKGKTDRAIKLAVKLIEQKKLDTTFDLIKVNEEIIKIEERFEKNVLDD